VVPTALAPVCTGKDFLDIKGTNTRSFKAVSRRVQIDKIYFCCKR